ncbi:TPA: hypothetical protein HA317_01375, partial [Candidatus Woesearchaeota archaeon]|nr:hypothetical protein [Candidatus Woesearchaeota archaeon]
MKQIFFATKNKGKLHSISTHLAKYNIEVIQKPLEIPELRSDDLAEIARRKVRYAFEHIKAPVMVIDAGFYIHALGGFPRAYVNFALKTIGITGILKLAQGIDRACAFRHYIAFVDKHLPEPRLFRSDVEGMLAEKPRGEMRDYLWSELSLIFIPEGKAKTMAEMTPSEYLAWREELHENSHVAQFAR